MIFRELTSEDNLRWGKLLYDLWELSDVDQEKTMSDIINSEKEVTIGCFDDELIGFVQVSIRTDYVAGTSTSPVGYIEGIIVDSNRRNEGVASKLIEEACKHSKLRGCTEIGSDVEIDNAVSISFHKRIGFTEQERVVCFSKKI